MNNHQALINKITRKIVEGAKPEKIVIFGSFATGTAGQDSDIDLLVIKESSLRRDERDREIRRFLKEVIYPMDIFVYTPEEAKRLSGATGSFLKKIFDTGKVLYERK